MTRAEPILRRHGVRLANENHKDWRIDETLSILRRIDSGAVGVTIDTGNSMSLLEGPPESARAFAPYANSVHLKDLGPQAYEDGFLLAEVPFGEGCLDMKAVVDSIRARRAEVRFTLEMITRGPLKGPCLRKEYWTTMGRVPGRDLVSSLEAVRNCGRSLPQIDRIPAQGRFRIEEENNRACLEYGKERLGI